MPEPLDGPEEAYVRAARVARVATTGAEGPHVVAICPALEDGKVVFATEADSRKVRNLRHEPRCCLVFDDYTESWDELKEIVVWGTAEIVEGGPRFEDWRRLLYEKFPQYERDAPIEPGDSVIVEVPVERIAGGL